MPAAGRTFATVGGAAAAAVLARKVVTSPQWRFARLGGWSIAGPTAAGWTTDFLNAAYFRRPAGVRQVDDLRLAFAILTTFWHLHGHRPLHGLDVAPFHRAFGVDRFFDRSVSARGTLDRRQLMEGAARLIGDWFPDAYADDARRGWGIAFPTEDAKAAYVPEQRLRHARVGPLTPPEAVGKDQTWHTYPAVRVPDADAVLASLARPETWPDYASEIGRFTPLRSGGLQDQTFEIEVVGHPTRRTPMFLRAYVTVTRALTSEQPDELRTWVDEVNDGLDRFGRDEPPAVPDGAEPMLGVDLTTHEGHFLGRARNRLILYRDGDGAFLRAAGTWDPLRWDLAQLYQRVGYASQHAIWGATVPEQSMLHQVGERVGMRA